MFIFNFLDNILFYTKYPLSLEYIFVVRNSLTTKKTLRNGLTFLSFWLFHSENFSCRMWVSQLLKPDRSFLLVNVI